jgi:hypothetical protein
MGVGGGGNMFDARKMTRFAKSLLARGCSHLVVVHDLDRNGITGELNDEKQLRAKLAIALANNPIVSTSVIIPIEELEAWLLSEQHPRPQNISNPKNMLRRLDRNYRTSDNAKIARHINIADIAKKCPSFRPLEEFIKGIA